MPLVGLGDLATIGPFGTTAELAAGGLGAELASVLSFLLGFLRLGTTALAVFAGAVPCFSSQDARRPLPLAIVTNLSNAAPTLLLVTEFGLGIRGAAIATVFAALLGTALLPPVLLPLFRRSGAGRPSVARLLDRLRVAARSRLGRDQFSRSLLLEAAFLRFAAVGSRREKVVLAADAVPKRSLTLSLHFRPTVSTGSRMPPGPCSARRSVRATRRRSGPWWRPASATEPSSR